MFATMILTTILAATPSAAADSKQAFYRQCHGLQAAEEALADVKRTSNAFATAGSASGTRGGSGEPEKRQDRKNPTAKEPGTSGKGATTDHDMATAETNQAKSPVETEENAVETAKRVLTGETVEKSVTPLKLEVEACRRFLRAENVMSAVESSVGTDLVKAMGEVVLDKATQAGWRLVQEELLALAKCGAERFRLGRGTCEERQDKVMPKTYAALEKSRLQDILAQPETVINAILVDWFDRLVGAETSSDLLGKLIVEVSVRDLFQAWRSNGRRGLGNAVQAEFKRAMIHVASETECGRLNLPEKGLWLAAQCMITADGEPNADGVANCPNLEDLATSRCGLTPAARDTLVGILRAHADVFATATAGVPKKTRARDGINLLFELVKLRAPSGESADGKKDERLEWLQSVVVGVLDDDWPRVTTGAISLIEHAIAQKLESDATLVGCKREAGKDEKAAKKCEPSSAYLKEEAELRGVAKLLTFLAGVGRYAASYSVQDREAAAKARKDAIADLVSRMANRSERTRGVVVSLGGSFGFIGGIRGAIGEGKICEGQSCDIALASPLHLGLGLAVDSYHGRKNSRKIGFHGELSILDLGQYIAFEQKELQLRDPQLTAALAPSVKLGLRLGLRETPVFLAGFGGINPFLRAERVDPATMAPVAGGMTFTVGLMLGVYVPFLDFN